MKTLNNAADRQEVLDRIAELSSGDRAAWGKMSVQQMLCHLADSYRLGLGEKQASPASGLLQRTLIKWLALQVPVKWMKGFPTRPEMEAGKGGTPPAGFEVDRAALLSLIARFAGELPNSCPEHPVFGRLTPAEWWRWGYLHADHHLRQFGC